MVELEVPGIIFTIPRTTIDSLQPDMESLAHQWKEIMEVFFEMEGYVMPTAQRYVTDVEISLGSAHSGYPIMDVPLETYLFDMSGGPDTLNSGEAWGCFHEIGHNVQDSRWTPTGLTETTCNIFAQYVNEKLFNRKPRGVNHWYTEQFRADDRVFEDLTNGPLLNIFMIVQEECGWDTFKRFFKFYIEELPLTLSPNTVQNKYSTIVTVLSKSCNKNLVPFFQWWNWPVLNATIEETKDLPVWENVEEMLETAEGECNGGDSCCTAEQPCGEGEGDCDSDDQCSPGMRCGVDNCDLSAGTFELRDDCCSSSVLCDGGDSCCTDDRPCGDGEGDCDNNNHCKTGLTCGVDNCDQLAGTFQPTDDCCFDLSSIIPPPGCVPDWVNGGANITGCAINSSGVLWCPTAVNTEGEYVSGSGQWKECSYQ